MGIRINSHETAPQTALTARARQRLPYRLAQRNDRAHYVEVQLGSTGGRRGQQDKHCLMRVQPAGTPAATVVDIGADAFDTLDRAAGRVTRMADEQQRQADRHDAKNSKEMST